MKILIIRFSSIGDIVLTSPVIRCLKLQLPDAEIHFCTKEKFRTLVEPNPYVTAVHTLDGSLTRLLNELVPENFDLVIDLHNNIRTLRIKSVLWKSKIRTFKKLNFAKWLLVRFKKNLLPDVHIVHRYLQTCSDFGVKYDGLGLDYFFPKGTDQLPVLISDLLPRPSFAVLVAGGTWATKRLPAVKMRELFEKAELPIVVIGDQNDKVLVAEAIGGFENKVLDLCGKLTLAGSAAVVKTASAVITHDTGLMHIAAALRKPIISIWGNTVPEFGMYPFYPDSFSKSEQFIAEVKDLSCRPCSKLGYDHCPKGHFHCMMWQDMDKTGAELKRITTPIA